MQSEFIAGIGTKLGMVNTNDRGERKIRVHLLKILHVVEARTLKQSSTMKSARVPVLYHTQYFLVGGGEGRYPINSILDLPASTSDSCYRALVA